MEWTINFRFSAKARFLREKFNKRSFSDSSAESSAHGTSGVSHAEKSGVGITMGGLKADYEFTDKHRSTSLNATNRISSAGPEGRIHSRVSTKYCVYFMCWRIEAKPLS